MRILHRLVALFSLVMAVAVSVGAPAPAPVGAAPGERYFDRIFPGATVDRDVVYGAAPDEDGKIQTLHLDVYRPTGDTARARPAIILAHGGGFVGGDKSQQAGLAIAYAQRGFVAMSIEYRMDQAHGGVSVPPDAADAQRILDATHDMQAAVRWARAKSATYGIDPQRVSVGGGSAGAVMAVVTAILPTIPGSSGTPGLSSKVCTALSMMGAGDPSLVDAGDAGAVFYHGTADPVVPYSLAVATHEAMDDAGLPTEMVPFPGSGHGFPPNHGIEQHSSEWLVEHMVERTDGCGAPVVPANRSFARAAYADLLGRAPSADEVTQEAGLLDVGATRPALLGRLTGSDEWLGAIVTGFYEDTLGRAPDADGLAFWVEKLRSGRWSVAKVAASFYAAPEYRSGTTQAWVEDLYEEILGRSGSAEDVAYWVRQATRHSPSWVAVRIYGSIESRQDRVRALYAHLLDRAPEASGLAFWADRVATTGDLALAKDLAGSAEYRTRAVARFPG